MSGKVKDLTGQRFTRLTVTGFDRRTPTATFWHCTCDCGTVKSIRGNKLVSGWTRSCGCLQKESTTRHGYSRSPEHRCWKSMLQRCYDNSCRAYPWYGGRGIQVCDRWRESFDNFLMDMGTRPDGHSIERIDYNGDYCPSNCKWITIAEQSRNRRSNINVEYEGKQYCLTDLCKLLGLNSKCINSKFPKVQSPN